MYTRRRFDGEIYALSDRHLHRADRERMLKIARNGQPDAVTSCLRHASDHAGALLIIFGERLQRHKEASLPVPILPRRVLTD